MSAPGVTLLAATAPKAAPVRGSPRSGFDGSILLPGLYLVLAMLIGAVIIAWVGRWRRSPRSGETASPSDQLARFRSLYDKGQMTREEFERIKARLAAQIRSEADLPPQPAPGPAPAPANSPPPANGRPAGEAPPDGIQPQ